MLSVGLAIFPADTGRCLVNRPLIAVLWLAAAALSRRYFK
jgi:hypothetical protein